MAKDHKVRQGECVMSIAHLQGLLWETVWNHPNNASLKEQREDPNVLLPGDIVHIPDIEKRQEQGAIDQQHEFVVKGRPAKLRLRLTRDKPPGEEKVDGAEFADGVYSEPMDPLAETEPRANTRYALYVSGRLVAEGETDGDGRLEETIPPAASSGKLILNPSTEIEQVIALNLGHMDPIEDLAGVCKRLFNIGYQCAVAREITPAIEAALRQFQIDRGLAPTGRVDAATRDQLKQAHGG